AAGVPSVVARRVDRRAGGRRVVRDRQVPDRLVPRALRARLGVRRRGRNRRGDAVDLLVERAVLRRRRRRTRRGSPLAATARRRAHAHGIGMTVSLVIIWSLSVLLLIGCVLLYALVKYVIPQRRARRRRAAPERVKDARRGRHITT